MLGIWNIELFSNQNFSPLLNISSDTDSLDKDALPFIFVRSSASARNILLHQNKPSLRSCH